MSKTVKFTISDEDYDDLRNRAGSESLIPDYVRKQLFPGQVLFTPQDAVNLALSKYAKGDRFSVPELFGDNWNLPNGMAGMFGKKFFALIEEKYRAQIRFTGNLNAKKHAVYEIL